MVYIFYFLYSAAMEMTFESAYKRLQEIYSIINSQDTVDIGKLTELQAEADKLYIYLQTIIKKDGDTKSDK